MKEKLKYRNLIEMPDGRIVNQKDLSPEENEKFKTWVTDTFMRAAGYKRTDDST